MKVHCLLFAIFSFIGRFENGKAFSVPNVVVASSSSSSNPVEALNPTSAKLLSLLQEKASNVVVDNDDEINSLVYSLIGSSSSFDPQTCINGPFYATCHFIGKEPLWEKIGKFTKNAPMNLKGQKYTINEDPNGENKVVNYSEIMGSGTYACPLVPYHTNELYLDNHDLRTILIFIFYIIIPLFIL